MTSAKSRLLSTHFKATCPLAKYIITGIIGNVCYKEGRLTKLHVALVFSSCQWVREMARDFYFPPTWFLSFSQMKCLEVACHSAPNVLHSINTKTELYCNAILYCIQAGFGGTQMLKSLSYSILSNRRTPFCKVPGKETLEIPWPHSHHPRANQISDQNLLTLSSGICGLPR